MGALMAVVLKQRTFVPPVQKAAPAVAAATMMGGAPVFADAIGDAAKALSADAYPLLKEVDWSSGLALTNPGSGSATDWAKAIAKAIDMGAAMDPKLVAPEVPNYLMASVKEADAKKAYEALMKFKDVVKANPITPAAASAPSGGKIDEAAAALTKAAYPLMKEVDWTSNLYLKKPGSVAAKDALAAVDKALVMGAAMDSGALKEAALAHVKAIGGMDAKGVLTEGDFTAITAGLGKAIAAVPTSKVMDVYNAFGKITGGGVPNTLYSTVDPKNAQAAYDGLMAFGSVVKASR